MNKVISASGFIWTRPLGEVPTTCQTCGQTDVRPEDGAHDWYTCGQHLLRQRDEARAESVRQMEYGIRQHEFAQDAMRERDAALKELARVKQELGWTEDLAASYRDDIRRLEQM